MSVFEIVLLGVALAMDAVAVGMTDGMSEPKMRLLKAAGIAGAFGLFQFFMPLLGYCAGSAFTNFLSKIAPVLSFTILAFLGVKMIFGCVRELTEKHPPLLKRERAVGEWKLFLQALATSIDALAIGVTLSALEGSGTLALSPILCSVVIGAVTFVLSFAAVLIGRKAGAMLADQAELFGGAVLVVIGFKIAFGL